MGTDQAQGWLMLITGIATAFASILAAWKASSAKADTTVVREQQAEIASKVDTVEVNTNSRVSKQDELIKNLSEEIKALTAHIAQQEQNRAVLAAEVKDTGNILPNTGTVQVPLAHIIKA